MQLTSSKSFFAAAAALLACALCQSPASAQTDTRLIDHDPPCVVTHFDPVKHTLTITVYSVMPPGSIKHEASHQSKIHSLTTSSDYANIDFYGRDDKHEAYTIFQNSLFVGLSNSPKSHAQAFFVNGTATRPLTLVAGAITKQKRLIAVVSYTEQGQPKGPIFTTVILNP